MAARFWVGGGSSSNWNATGPTNWSATSGGSGNASVPGASDDVTFDGAGTGNSASTISAIITVLSFTVTSGYTNTITHNAILTVAGNVTLNTSYTISGSSSMTISAASTITSNGKTWPNDMSFSGTNTKTLSGNFTISGTLTCAGTTTLNKTTSETITCGGLTVNAGTSGTAEIILSGGTWSGNGNVLSSSLTFAGNITATGTLDYQTGTLKYTSGTVTTTGSTIRVRGSITANTNGITWNNITCQTATQTWTLTSNFSMSGLLTISAVTTFNKSASETFTTSGGMAINANLGGTADIYATGGTWSSTTTITFTNNLFIAGNVTVSGSVYYSTGTIKYNSGTPVLTSSTLNILGSCTLDTNGITWNNITLSTAGGAGFTYTLNSLLSLSGIFDITVLSGLGPTFAGTAGFTTPTLKCDAISAINITLKNGVTYTVTSSLSVYKSYTNSIVVFTSDDSTIKAILTLTNPAACNVLASFTRIDASAGRTINTFNGIITSCNNIREFNDLQTIGF